RTCRRRRTASISIRPCATSTASRFHASRTRATRSSSPPRRTSAPASARSARRLRAPSPPAGYRWAPLPRRRAGSAVPTRGPRRPRTSWAPRAWETTPRRPSSIAGAACTSSTTSTWPTAPCSCRRAVSIRRSRSWRSACAWPATSPAAERRRSPAGCRGRTVLRRCRDRMLRRPLEAVAQHAREVEEHLRGDPGIAALHALEEALVNHQHLDVRPGDDVCRAHAVPDEGHLAEDVAALVLGDAPAMTDLVALPDLGAPVENHEHLVARVALPDDLVLRLEAPHLAHEHDHARLRGAKSREQRDRARRIVAEPQADEVPERDDLRGPEHGRKQDEVRDQGREHRHRGEDPEV